MKKMLLAAIMLLQLTGLAYAEACSLPAPQNAVILTVEGQIQACNSGLEAHFDLAMLEALPKFTVKTANPWEQSPATFEGVLLRDLIDHIKATGTALKITALNDYRAELSVADVKAYDIILAYKRNGEYMPVRDKGPLFVVFPFSDVPSLSTEARYAQSVWQVAHIAVQ